MWFPTVEQVIRIHDDVLEFSGGEPGVLNRGAIEAAIERARWGPFPGEDDLPARAAMLLRGIAQDHPFVDGKKRTAYETVDTFLARNGVRLEVDEDEALELLLAVAQGRRTAGEIREWLVVRLRND